VRGAPFLVVITLACRRESGVLPAGAEAHPALAATSGVVQAEGAPGAREPVIVPLRPLHGDVELLHGHPDVAGGAVRDRGSQRRALHGGAAGAAAALSRSEPATRPNPRMLRAPA